MRGRPTGPRRAAAGSTGGRENAAACSDPLVIGLRFSPDLGRQIGRVTRDSDTLSPRYGVAGGSRRRVHEVP